MRFPPCRILPLVAFSYCTRRSLSHLVICAACLLPTGATTTNTNPLPHAMLHPFHFPMRCYIQRRHHSKTSNDFTTKPLLVRVSVRLCESCLHQCLRCAAFWPFGQCFHYPLGPHFERRRPLNQDRIRNSRLAFATTKQPASRDTVSA